MGGDEWKQQQPDPAVVAHCQAGQLGLVVQARHLRTLTREGHLVPGEGLPLGVDGHLQPHASPLLNLVTFLL